MSTSIAIDSNDAIHISYFDNQADNLNYATCSSGCTTGSNWSKVSVDTPGNVGSQSSIAIDSNDAIHISYSDGTNGRLKYATCSSGCTAEGNWSKVRVDTASNVGSWNSIAIDSNDAVHISYFDDTGHDLKYATCSSSCLVHQNNWDKVYVDSVGDVGEYSSIAIDSYGFKHISYFDDTNDDLKYATDQTGSWVTTSVDATWHSVGKYSSIAIDSNDGVHISYYDDTNSNLKYATCSSACSIASNWDTVTAHA
ncbi:MAG: carboxypeptidase regulatory-like domain-containing protein, partial [Candidatus Thermoplasmatota archaeon]|nr:carboxypeptidase regulatory-like domain-containing protein [Candidatus Thermoplasmatota archaeon]